MREKKSTTYPNEEALGLQSSQCLHVSDSSQEPLHSMEPICKPLPCPDLHSIQICSLMISPLMPFLFSFFAFFPSSPGLELTI